MSVSAVACRPTLTDGGRVTLDWRDGAGGSTRIGTTTAHPSGAFDQEVRLPRSSAIGGGEITISGVEAPCADTGSCAAYGAFVTVVDPEPDFAADDRANHVAADIADRMQAAIEHRASFFEISIVPDGLEVVLHTSRFDRERAAAERAFEAARAVVPAADRAIADGAHLHVLLVQHDRAALERLTTRIAHDGAWQRRNRIQLSQWGPDSATDSVRIAVVHYSDAAAIRLLERYGDAISVSTLNAPLGSPS
ncbi:hypothetical protein [Amnibacterium setariae]|uniref:hypothetical protein n=1 Tax=Amnibacterium setariae TaxID=2306585 RepID=UPI001314B282|nr:hypothetical protein [Amnibacterium setariae]